MFVSLANVPRLWSGLPYFFKPSNDTNSAPVSNALFSPLLIAYILWVKTPEKDVHYRLVDIVCVPGQDHISRTTPGRFARLEGGVGAGGGAAAGTHAVFTARTALGAREHGHRAHAVGGRGGGEAIGPV